MRGSLPNEKEKIRPTMTCPANPYLSLTCRSPWLKSRGQSGDLQGADAAVGGLSQQEGYAAGSLQRMRNGEIGL